MSILLFHQREGQSAMLEEAPGRVAFLTRNGQGADKGLCQLDGSIRVNHVTVHTPTLPPKGILDKVFASGK